MKIYLKDKEKEDKINFPEFLNFMAKEYMKDVITEPEVLEAFKVFDKEGYGTVNINEIRYVLNQLKVNSPL
jgi:calmodulin